MLDDETKEYAEKAMKILKEHLKYHPLRKTVTDIVGTNPFILEETLTGYATNTIVDLPYLLQNNKEDVNFDKVMKICKERLDKYNKELLRPSKDDIVITEEDIKKDNPDAITEAYPIFKLMLHYMNKYGISRFFKEKYTDPKELRKKVLKFIDDYFGYVISQSSEDSRENNLLDIYGVVILRDNLKVLLIDWED